jgi:hypothetical protein
VNRGLATGPESETGFAPTRGIQLLSLGKHEKSWLLGIVFDVPGNVWGVLKRGRRLAETGAIRSFIRYSYNRETLALLKELNQLQDEGGNGTTVADG